MSASGLCEICDRPSVEHTCDRCGKLVCDRHWDDTRGVCVECAAELGDGDERVDDPPDMPEEGDTYEF